MDQDQNIIANQLVQGTEISRKIWKFIIEVATDNGNCSHIEKAKQLLKEISQNL
jgi:hypothetical protein